VTTAGGVHRIESGNGSINAPHLPAISECRDRQPVIAGDHGTNGQADEGFGAGIG